MGRATTNTVVLAAILVLVSDFFLTKLFYLLALRSSRDSRQRSTRSAA